MIRFLQWNDGRNDERRRLQRFFPNEQQIRKKHGRFRRRRRFRVRRGVDAAGGSRSGKSLPIFGLSRDGGFSQIWSFAQANLTPQQLTHIAFHTRLPVNKNLIAATLQDYRSMIPHFNLENVCKPGSTLLWDLVQDDKIVSFDKKCRFLKTFSRSLSPYFTQNFYLHFTTVPSKFSPKFPCVTFYLKYPKKFSMSP